MFPRAPFLLVCFLIPQVISAWREFYLTLLPLPSSFELPDGQTNQFGSITEYQQLSVRVVARWGGGKKTGGRNALLAFSGVISSTNPVACISVSFPLAGSTSV